MQCSASREVRACAMAHEKGNASAAQGQKDKQGCGFHVTQIRFVLGSGASDLWGPVGCVTTHPHGRK